MMTVPLRASSAASSASTSWMMRESSSSTSSSCSSTSSAFRRVSRVSGRRRQRRRFGVQTSSALNDDDVSSSSSSSSYSPKKKTLKIFSVNDVYELENLGRLSRFIRDQTNEGRDPYICTLNGDFLSPSLLSSYDLGAAAVSVMNSVPVTHACLGNHEFDHSTMILGQRLSELDATVLNSNVRSTDAFHGLDENGARVGAFVDDLPSTERLELGGLKIGLLGVCTTSTPLSSAVKPRGVVFQDVVPIVRRIVRDFDHPKNPDEDAVDLTIALTHQTLCEDETLAREVPELGLILGGHEHHPFHGAIEGTDVLCLKAGMDSENVVVVTLELADDDDEDDELAVEDASDASHLSASARRVSSITRAIRVGSPATTRKQQPDIPRDDAGEADTANDEDEDTTAAAAESLGMNTRGAGWDVKPGEQSTIRTRRGNVYITATLHSLYGYERCEKIHRDIWERSKVLRDLHEYVLPLHEHAQRLGLLPLSSLDVRQKQTTLGALFATILRDESQSDLCLYNSGGVRANKVYDAPLTYGDLVAEVPFENNIITLEMSGDDIYRALSYSEEQKTETCSWGGYLLWDKDVVVDVKDAKSGDLDIFIRGQPLDRERQYRVVTWAGLLEGTDGIPAFEEVGKRLVESLGVESGSVSSATFSDDGVPFKILIMRHLCRWRWGQLREVISFDEMDRDGDDKLEAEDVQDALERFTASASSKQEAESMVRLFDVDGDGKISKHEWLALLDVCC
jgi:2',3'-cyclic-nucleotide 2'-phosphodiesterase (5'-nucleotidase family)